MHVLHLHLLWEFMASKEHSSFFLVVKVVLALVWLLSTPFLAMNFLASVSKSRECDSWSEAAATITESKLLKVNRPEGQRFVPQISYSFVVGDQQITSARIGFEDEEFRDSRRAD